jgi:t-SNARE complex subunit (syntaxin)
VALNDCFWWLERSEEDRKKAKTELARKTRRWKWLHWVIMFGVALIPIVLVLVGVSIGYFTWSH